jgi:hypothetical protein
MTFHWSDIQILAGVILGGALAYERWSPVEGNPELPLPQGAQPAITCALLVMMWAVAAALEAHTARGFLYLALEPLGAGLAAFALLQPVAQRYGERRRNRLIVKWRAGGPYP